MNKSINGTEIRNAEKFEAFIAENMESYDLDSCYAGMVRHWGETGSLSYELGRSSTKSGRPELISYEVVHVYLMPDGRKIELGANDSAPDDLDNFMQVETIIVF